MILVADIGGTKIAAARADASGVLMCTPLQTPTQAHLGPEHVLETTAALLGQLRSTDDCFVGISTAGVVDAAKGTVLAATSSMPGWGGTPLASLLHERTGLPTWALNDGNAFGLGLAAEYGTDNLLALVAGTGIGGSLVLNGLPVLGAHHAGGHLGHVASPEAAGMPCPCGRTGHLEAVASGHGILAWYHANGGATDVRSAAELSTRREDTIAQSALRTGGSALGVAAAGLVNAVDPDLVVVSGSVARAGEPWSTALRAGFASGLIPAAAGVGLDISLRGTETALRGAAHYVLRRMNP